MSPTEPQDFEDWYMRGLEDEDVPPADDRDENWDELPHAKFTPAEEPRFDPEEPQEWYEQV